MFQALENERRIGGHLRVRRWHHREALAVSGPEAFHAAVEVSWVESGLTRYRIGGRPFEVERSSAMVVPAGVGHLTSMEGGTLAGSVWIGAEAMAQLSDALGRRPRGLSAGLAENAERIITLGRLLQAEAFTPGAGGLQAADALAEVLALQVLRAEAPRVRALPPSPPVRRALERIEADFAEPLQVEQLAREAGMSRFHFSRRFLEQVGMSPYAYLQEVRLRRAAELLKRGHATVAEAAFSVGFSDLGRFGRKFRQKYGCVPSRFAGGAVRARASLTA